MSKNAVISIGLSMSTRHDDEIVGGVDGWSHNYHIKNRTLIAEFNNLTRLEFALTNLVLVGLVSKVRWINVNMNVSEVL